MASDHRHLDNRVDILADASGGKVIVTLTGEFDLADQQSVRDAVDAALLWFPTEVRIDLTPVTFIDMVAMRSLLDGVHYARHLGVRVELATTSAHQRVLRLLQEPSLGQQQS